MRDTPKLAETTIRAAIHEHYGVAVAALSFLPLGLDSATAVYRVEAADGAAFFLKSRTMLAFSLASVAVARYLHELGVPYIVAPLLSKSHSPWVAINDFALTLYPFIDGRIGAEAGLSEQHWIALGQTLKQIHTSLLPPELTVIIRRETFVPSRRHIIDRLGDAVGGRSDPVGREFAEFWRSRREQIRTIVDRADTLGGKMRMASVPSVLCHADLHTFNVLLEETGQWWIVDWDETVLAPKERDLMFFAGGIMRGLIQPHQTEAFFRGYGSSAIDPGAIAYYRYARAVEDMSAYGERVFFLPEAGEETRRDALAGFQQLFEPGNIVEIAFAADR